MKRTFVVLSPGKIAKLAKQKGVTIEQFTKAFRHQQHADIIPKRHVARDQAFRRLVTSGIKRA